MKRSNTITSTTTSKRVKRNPRTAKVSAGNALPDYQPRTTVPSTLSNSRKEVKAISIVPILGGSITTPGTVFPMCIQIPLGDDFNQRDGRAVRLLEIAWTLTTLTLAGAAAAFNTHVRLIVFQWKQPGLFPNTNTILDAGNINSQYQQQQSPLYKILFDKVYEQKQEGASTTQDVRTFNQGKAKLGFEMAFPTGANPNAVNNSVYAIVVGSDTTGTFTVKASTKFVDL